jgi:hypothetical protein
MFKNTIINNAIHIKTLTNNSRYEILDVSFSAFRTGNYLLNLSEGENRKLIGFKAYTQ